MCHHPPVLLWLLGPWCKTFPQQMLPGCPMRILAGHPGEVGVLTAGCWWCHGWLGRAGCGSPPHSHPTHPAQLGQVAQMDFEPLIRCRRCREGCGGATLKGGGGLHPASPHCVTPLPGASGTGCSPPNPSGRPHGCCPTGCWPWHGVSGVRMGVSGRSPPAPGVHERPHCSSCCGQARGWCQDNSTSGSLPPRPGPAALFGVTASAGTFAQHCVNDPPVRATAASPQQPPR